MLLPLAIFIVKWQIPAGLKFVILLAGTFIVSMGIYELLVRRFNLLRSLFGMKPASRIIEVQPSESQLIELAR